MEEKIIEIIEKISGYKNLRENRNIDLLENEILDSLAFIELLTALEDEFNIEIQPTQVSPDTWRSITSIANLVTRLGKN
jgi:D-alanine--poly(phosphoribitol) ligase subunit 2